MTDTKISRSEQKRQAILTAAKIAFKENGVQATSMDKLAEMAQVSKRTVYNHFDTKEALVMHLVTDLWQKAMTTEQACFDNSKPLNEQLSQLVQQEIELLCSNEYIDLSRVAFGHLFYNPEALQAEVTKISKQESAIQQWIVAANNAGKLEINDVEFATAQLHHLIKGSCFWPQLLQIAPPLTAPEMTKICDEAIKMFLARYQTA